MMPVALTNSSRSAAANRGAFSHSSVGACRGSAVGAIAPFSLSAALRGRPGSGSDRPCDRFGLWPGLVAQPHNQASRQLGG